MAETNQTLRKYRDVLESIINSTMEHLDHLSGTEEANNCPCANCDSAKSIDDGEENNLAFEQMAFEFPLHSHPIDAAENGLDRRTTAVSGTMSKSPEGDSARMPPQPQTRFYSQAGQLRGHSISYRELQCSQDINFGLQNQWEFPERYSVETDWFRSEQPAQEVVEELIRNSS